MWVYVGGTSPDIARAYADLPARSALKQGGSAWFIGAGGPMGRMHVQRAIQVAGAPAVIVCTDVSDLRLADLQESYGAEAADTGDIGDMDARKHLAGLVRDIPNKIEQFAIIGMAVDVDLLHLCPHSVLLLEYVHKPLFVSINSCR